METREAISLDDQAQRRLRILNHLLAGAEALVHGNRGRRPANRTADTHRERVVGLATTRYGGLDREHTADLLAEEQGLTVTPRTLRRWLSDEGVPTVRRRRAPQHRRRRARMAQAGLLLQVDGSRHDWLGGRGPMLTLVGGIDDATGLVTGATFRDQEDAAGYFTLLVQTVRRHGRPAAIYSDRHGIFWRDPARAATLAEELVGKRSLTQLGRALDQAGIGWIAARSPQAEGRVERLWGTLQERLVGELRLAGDHRPGTARRQPLGGRWRRSVRAARGTPRASGPPGPRRPSRAALTAPRASDTHGARTTTTVASLEAGIGASLAAQHQGVWVTDPLAGQVVKVGGRRHVSHQSVEDLVDRRTVAIAPDLAQLGARRP